MSSRRFGIVGILIVLVGAFMLLDGISALTQNTQGLGGFSHDISRAFGKAGNTVAIILAVVEVAAGALLILSRFMSIGALDSGLRIAVFIFWIVVMLFALVLGGNINAIDTIGWWKALVNHLIILLILWLMTDNQ